MKLQTFFDVAIAGIVAQGGPATDQDGDICRYRMGNLKCAIGHHIPDASYHPTMEATTLTGIVAAIRSGNLRGLGGDKDIAIAAVPDWLDGIEGTDLADLQRVHDSASQSLAFWPRFRELAENYAGRHDLNTDVLSTIPRDAAAPKGWRSVGTSHD